MRSDTCVLSSLIRNTSLIPMLIYLLALFLHEGDFHPMLPGLRESPGWLRQDFCRLFVPDSSSPAHLITYGRIIALAAKRDILPLPLLSVHQSSRQAGGGVATFYTIAFDGWTSGGRPRSLAAAYYSARAHFVPPRMAQAVVEHVAARTALGAEPYAERNARLGVASPEIARVVASPEVARVVAAHGERVRQEIADDVVDGARYCSQAEIDTQAAAFAVSVAAQVSATAALATAATPVVARASKVAAATVAVGDEEKVAAAAAPTNAAPSKAAPLKTAFACGRCFELTLKVIQQRFGLLPSRGSYTNKDMQDRSSFICNTMLGSATECKVIQDFLNFEREFRPDWKQLYARFKANETAVSGVEWACFDSASELDFVINSSTAESCPFTNQYSSRPADAQQAPPSRCMWQRRPPSSRSRPSSRASTMWATTSSHPAAVASGSSGVPPTVSFMRASSWMTCGAAWIVIISRKIPPSR
jgi:hypothetical protein